MTRTMSAPGPGSSFRPTGTAESFGISSDSPGMILLSDSQKALRTSTNHQLTSSTKKKEKKPSEVEKRIMNSPLGQPIISHKL